MNNGWKVATGGAIQLSFPPTVIPGGALQSSTALHVGMCTRGDGELLW